MKKIFLAICLICFLIAGTELTVQAASSAYNAQIKNAIAKYKVKNYVGCIQDLQPVVKKDPSNTVAHYYLANAYMKLGNKDKATEEFDNVININSAPILTSYSVQAKLCIEADNMTKCQYKKISTDQIPKLMEDPQGFLDSLNTKVNTVQQTLDPEKAEIEKLIHGKYPSNIHPEAKKVIIDTMLKKETDEANTSVPLSAKPSNDEIAAAVKTLAQAGINPLQFNTQIPQYTNNDYSSLSMMMANSQPNNNYVLNMMPYLMQQSQNGNKQISPEMMQALMMSQMMPDFNFNQNNKY